MSQQFLHMPQRSAALQQVRCETVAERVRRDLLGYAGALGVRFQYEPETLTAEPLPAPV